jgi:hypothetical protein
MIKRSLKLALLVVLSVGFATTSIDAARVDQWLALGNEAACTWMQLPPPHGSTWGCVDLAGDCGSLGGECSGVSKADCKCRGLIE